MTWAIRAVSVVLLSWGTYLVLMRIALAGITGDFQVAFLSWSDGVGESHPLYRGLAMLLLGAALAVISRSIPRWAFPAMPEGCPRCGYEKVEQGRCPECGLSGFKPPS